MEESLDLTYQSREIEAPVVDSVVEEEVDLVVEEAVDSVVEEVEDLVVEEVVTEVAVVDLEVEEVVDVVAVATSISKLFQLIRVES